MKNHKNRSKESFRKGKGSCGGKKISCKEDFRKNKNFFSKSLEMVGKNTKRINREIRASQVSVISEQGEPLGTISLDAAIEKAEEQDLDVVEIGIQNGVVLAKIMDYGKFLFKQQKNLSHGKASSKKTDVKTLKITYKIGDHDLSIRRNQAEKFAHLGHSLKVMLTLRGRENQYSDLANAKMQEFVDSLSPWYKTQDVKIIKTANNFSILLYPKK